MKNRLIIAIIIILSVVVLGCPNIFGPLDNPVDPESDEYQGFDSVASAADVVMESIEWDGNTLVFKCSLCVGAETYSLQISSQSTDFEANLLRSESSDENEWEVAGVYIISDTIYYRFRIDDSEWSDIASHSAENPDPPPADVTDLSVSVADGQVTVSWTPPADSDFSHCELWYGTGGTADTQYTDSVNASGTTISGLTNQTEYIFKVITVDSAGNKSDGLTITAVPDDLYLADQGFVLKTVIPEGETVTFTMGDDIDFSSNNDEHEVILGRSFLMSETEITQSQYYEVTGESPSSGYGVGDDYPVYNITWYNALYFCNALSDFENLDFVYWADDSLSIPYSSGTTVYLKTNANGYRLPTEAEWEYAARSGKDDSYAGSSLNVNQVAWYNGNSDGASHEVKDKSANDYGLYDMSGNVYEWCWDWYGTDIDDPTTYYFHYDPVGPDSGSERTRRGGSFFHDADNSKIKPRSSASPESAYNFNGFRVVRQTGSTDVTPPAEVTGLSAEEGSSMVTLTWTAPEDSDFDHYEVCYGADGSADTEFTTGTIDPAGTVVTGFSNETEYTFLVKTFDTSGNESIGSSVTATPIVLEVSGLSVEEGSSMATLTWTNPTGDGFDYCEVWYGTGGSADTEFTTGTIDPSGTVISGLTNDVEYTFSVKTVDNESSVSPGAEVTGTPNLPEVTSLSVSVGSSQVTLSWTNPVIDGYSGVNEVWYGTGGIADTEFDGTISSAGTTILNLTNDNEYTFLVKCVDDAAYTTDGSSQIGTPNLPEVTSLSITPGSSQATLTWTNPTIDGYSGANEVWYGTGGSVDTEFTGTISSAGTTITNLTNDSEYTFLVQCVDDNSYTTDGNSETGTPNLPEVTDFTVTPGSTQATLTWTNPSVVGFDHCEVWYGTGGIAATQFLGTVDAAGTDITGLSMEVYTFEVIAVDSIGIESNGSEVDCLIVEETKLTASDGASSDVFGLSVNISGDGERIVIGARGDDDLGSESGSVYIYDWNGSSWDESKLNASDGTADDHFGSSVSISDDGNTVGTGSFYDDMGDASGSVYLYEWNGSSWDETKLTASDGAADDHFGSRVSISGDGNTVAVSAAEDDDNGTQSGSIYVYEWNGSSWGETKLTASDGAADDHFGNDLSISDNGETIIVGAYWDDDDGSASGAAYVYKWNGSSWDETKLTASDAAAEDVFGVVVSISGDGGTIIIGANSDDDQGNASGSIYIYEWNGSSWDETKLTATDGAEADWFGIEVTVADDGQTIVAGARGDDDNGSVSGSSYVLSWNGSSWIETKLIASDGAANDSFGGALGISDTGNTIIIGAFGDYDHGLNTGAAYIYK